MKSIKNIDLIIGLINQFSTDITEKLKLKKDPDVDQTNIIKRYNKKIVNDINKQQKEIKQKL